MTSSDGRRGGEDIKTAHTARITPPVFASFLQMTISVACLLVCSPAYFLTRSTCFNRPTCQLACLRRWEAMERESEGWNFLSLSAMMLLCDGNLTSK